MIFILYFTVLNDKQNINFILCFQNIGKNSFLDPSYFSINMLCFRAMLIVLTTHSFIVSYLNNATIAGLEYRQTSLPGLITVERVHGRWCVTVTAVLSHSFAAPPVCGPRCPVATLPTALHNT